MSTELLRWIPNRRSSALGLLRVHEHTLSELILRYDALDEDSDVLAAVSYTNSPPVLADFPTVLEPVSGEDIRVDKSQGLYALITIQFVNPRKDLFLNARIIVRGFNVKVDVLLDEEALQAVSLGAVIESENGGWAITDDPSAIPDGFLLLDENGAPYVSTDVTSGVRILFVNNVVWGVDHAFD